MGTLHRQPYIIIPSYTHHKKKPLLLLLKPPILMMGTLHHQPAAGGGFSFAAAMHRLYGPMATVWSLWGDFEHETSQGGFNRETPMKPL